MIVAWIENNVIQNMVIFGGFPFNEKYLKESKGL